MRPMTIIAALGTAGGVLAACATPISLAEKPQPKAAPPAAAPAAPLQGAQAPAQPEGLRIILRLKDRRAPVDVPQTLDRLGSLCASQLTYVRPMADDAHVLVLTPGPGMSADEALGLLRSSRLVDYVEPDAVRKAQ